MSNDEEKKPPEDKAHLNAIAALTQFVSKYEPADKYTADTFFTTNQIIDAIADHTGKTLQASDVYELMRNMQYTYEAMNGLEFYWLLRKE